MFGQGNGTAREVGGIVLEVSTDQVRDVFDELVYGEARVVLRTAAVPPDSEPHLVGVVGEDVAGKMADFIIGEVFVSKFLGLGRRADHRRRKTADAGNMVCRSRR